MKITYPDEAAWLADRPSRIGASEAPGILGCGYANESTISTFAKKVNPTLDEVIDATERERMELGSLQESVIREAFRRRTGLDVTHEPFTVYVSDERSHVGATLDGEVCDSDGPAVWEAKNVDHYMADEWDDGALPLRVQIQTQQQMYARGYQRAYIAALIGGNRLVWSRSERDDLFLNAMLPILDEFWGYVLRRECPPVDDSTATAKALGQIYGADDGNTIQLPAEAGEWDTSLQRIKKTIKRLEGKQIAIENKIKAEIKGASYGEIPGGGRYSLKQTERKGYTVKAAKFRTLRRLKK